MAVVLLHHTRKSPAKSKKKPITLDDAIGSSVLIRLIGVIIAIEAYSADDEDYEFFSVKNQSIYEAEKRAEAKTVVVKVLKTWFHEFSPFTFTILTQGDKTKAVIDLFPTYGEKERKELQNWLLEYIQKTYGKDRWFKSSEIPAELTSDDDGIIISSRHVRRLLTIMVKQGMLRKKGFARSTIYQLL